MKKNYLSTITALFALSVATLTGCGNNTTNESPNESTIIEDITTQYEASELVTTKPETTEVITTAEPTTTEIVTEEPTTVVYADWIDTLHEQMVALDFDSVLATITKDDFLDKCAIYESYRVSTAYENQCYRLPISTGGIIGVVHTSYQLTIFYCPNNDSEHEDHRNGFSYIGYGDIVVKYTEKGVVTCDGVHIKSTLPEQSSFDMEPGGIWIVWSV